MEKFDFNSMFDEVANSIFDETPSYINHYTSPSGLLGILSSQSLWFTNGNYLNDNSELKYVYEVIDMTLSKNKYKYSESFIQYMEMKYTNQINVIMNSVNKSNIYICSFSKINDSLSLWNYYTKSNSKAGYNLTFKTDELIFGLKNDEYKYNFKIGKVIYDSDEQISIMDIVLTKLDDYFKTIAIDKETFDKGVVIIDNIIEEIVHYFGSFFKHSAFANEQEIRLTCEVSDKSAKPESIREQNGIFAPYIEVKFDKACIEGITISPYVKNYNKELSIYQLIEKYEYNVRIYSSLIPVVF